MYVILDLCTRIKKVAQMSLLPFICATMGRESFVMSGSISRARMEEKIKATYISSSRMTYIWYF
uniref:Uncharacterized protein n=1 Tax=Arundo donax TaxID=35708 RepID=A0A0A8YP19_ARUDO